MKPVSVIAATIFILVAIAHLIRYYLGWVIMINGMVIPLWVSVPGALVPAIMAFLLLTDDGKKV